MSYEIKDLISVLKNIHKNKKSIIYTENFLEKIEQRKISDTFVEDRLQFTRPVFIKKFQNYHGIFELIFPFNYQIDLKIILKLILPDSLILLSAILTKRLKDKL